MIMVVLQNRAAASVAEGQIVCRIVWTARHILTEWALSKNAGFFRVNNNNIYNHVPHRSCLKRNKNNGFWLMFGSVGTVKVSVVFGTWILYLTMHLVIPHHWLNIYVALLWQLVALHQLLSYTTEHCQFQGCLCTNHSEAFTSVCQASSVGSVG